MCSRARWWFRSSAIPAKLQQQIDARDEHHDGRDVDAWRYVQDGVLCGESGAEAVLDLWNVAGEWVVSFVLSLFALCLVCIRLYLFFVRLITVK